MKQIKGNELSVSEQRRALAMFVNRYTGDHTPQWIKCGVYKTPPLQFANDADWLANTLFYVTSSGRISGRHKYCHSNPTWPNNPELR